MSVNFSDNFTETKLLTHNFINVITSNQSNVTGLVPSSWIRTIGFDSFSYGTTNGLESSLNIIDKYAAFGSVGGDYTNPTRRPPNTFAITETFTAGVYSTNNWESSFLKSFYNLSYKKGDNFLNIAGKTGIKLSGIGMIKSPNGGPHINLETISVKVTIYSSAGLIVGKLEGNYFYINEIETTQIVPISNLVQSGLFYPNYVNKIDFEFYVARNVDTNFLIPYEYSFWVDKISLV